MTTAGDVRRVYAEGRAASPGTANPYNGQIILATVWRAGYQRMLDDKLGPRPDQQ